MHCIDMRVTMSSFCATTALAEEPVSGSELSRLAQLPAAVKLPKG